MGTRDPVAVLPEHLEQTIRGFMASRCLLTALELDIFTAVGNGATAEQVAKKTETNTRGMTMLLNALVALRLLSKNVSEYKNTPESARFFVQGSKDNQRDGLLHTANIWHRWSTLTEAVRCGTKVALKGTDSSKWTQNFIAGMERNAKLRAPLVVNAIGTAGVRRVLDLGGGSGAYSIAFAKASPTVQCAIIDLPGVAPLTADYVRNAGASGQISIRAGDMLQDDLGSGYDLIMLNAICHMFSEQQNRELFSRARQALAPHGRLAVQDFILDADKTGPPQAALFALNMLVGTDSGTTYTEREYTDWMKACGFSQVTRINLPGPSDLIVGVVGWL